MALWFAVYEKESGNLVSVGTVLTDPMPEHLAVSEIGDREDANELHEKYEWDSANRQFVEKPPAPAVEQDLSNMPQLMEQFAQFLKEKQGG